jgi:class 3 adenylate cyclase/tetratricopeptide (TPR) repeat protein
MPTTQRVRYSAAVSGVGERVICSKCGTENEPGRKFCGECGAPLSIVCPNCGTPNTPGVKFCGECATPLVVSSAAGAPAAAAPQSPAPTPTAERRLVSVLFADLVGFTPFAEERDAEEVRDTLTRYFDESRTVIERYGGTVEKFIGDAVMAVWGTPIAQEDDAERAVRAGLDLLESVRGLGPTIQARVGVLTGETAVTIGATDQGMVAGDLVNTAARLQSIAAPGTVLVGESTRRAASASIEFEEAGDQVLKGKAAPVPAYRAVRVLAQRGGQGRSELPEPPFVGRDEELRLLKEMIALSGREPKARLVSITGPAGIGKSRLAWELEKYLDGVVETVYWHRGRSPSYGQGVTFWALGEIVRRRLSLAENDDDATTRERVHAGVVEWIPEPDDQRWVEPALLTLLGIEEAPAGGRDHLFAAWRILFERIAARGTAVLLFEDLQWADSGLLDFIDYLLEWVKGLPILIVTLARPELFDRRPTWGAGQRNFTAVDLEPLSTDEMRTLLEGFVPGLPRDAVDAIVARADGVPLYAVETVRSLLADGRLQRTETGYRPTGELGALAIPDTLRSLIAARLDALDPIDRGMLQDASVLGQSFTFDALAAINTRDDLDERLRDMVRRQLLEVEADPRSPERGQYRFVQELIREVAYGTLAKRQRREKHLAAARRFEAAGDHQLAGALASHYLAAYEASAAGPEQDAVAAQARIALRGAAERAAQLGAHDQAVAYLRQALDVTTSPGDRAALLERAAFSANVAGHNELAVALAEEAMSSSRETGDLAGLARSAAVIGDALIDIGDPGRAVGTLESVLDDLPPTDEVNRAAVLTNLARAHYRNNAPVRAVAVADQALPLAEAHELDGLIANLLNNKGSALSYVGRYREAVALMEAAIRVAGESGFVEAELRARGNLAAIVWYRDMLRAFELERETLELAQRLGSRLMSYWMIAARAPSAFFLGRDWDAVLAEADESLEANLEPAAEEHVLVFVAPIRAARADRLGELIERVTALAKQLSAPHVAWDIEWLRAMQLLFHEGRPAEASDIQFRAAQHVEAVRSIYLGWSGRAAIWAMDGDRLERARVALEAEPVRSQMRSGELIEFTAALAGMDGRVDEALAGFRAAIDGQREANLLVPAAWMAIDQAIVLGPEIEAVRRDAAWARELLEGLGARAFLDRLNEAMEAPRSTRVEIRQSAESADRSTELKSAL